MRIKTEILFLTLLLAAALAPAQNYKAPPPFKHVVIVFQENRTPDNLFGSAPSGARCGTEDPFEPGVDIENGGPNLASKNNGGPYVTCLQANSSLATGGGNHDHQDIRDNAGWVAQCDLQNGQCQMDGACLATGSWPSCPEYQYVTKPTVQPYFDIATNYGFANYMFSTHQGPSFEGHQFILGGTSAPVFPGDSQGFYQDFVAENGNYFYDAGCAEGSAQGPNWINPGGFELSDQNNSECYDHNTLVTYQDSNGVHDRGVSWTYYTPDDKEIIWDAPGANPQICYSATSGSGPCAGTEWSHVSVAANDNSVPILKDIANCNLSAISWAIPDERWSDHPGFNDANTGPEYVAAIVDAIGNSYKNSGGKCDYWGAYSSNPEPTAIFITWDDWGGFFDHVPPPVMYEGRQVNGKWVCDTTKAPNGWGCGYVFGFRVPLLVVSEYTPPGYVSGAISGTPTYPPLPQWTHDFGSILAFTENNFGLLPIAQPGPTKYTYADQNSLDAKLSNGQSVVPLWDFFLGPQRGFTSIQPVSQTHDASYFMNYYANTNSTPIGPEDGDPND